ncbi:hypothetical protein [Hymenobacter sp. 5516J-16]|uniref:hypothetical protein n=1 Tax=Hymenobacter sp. 5516J-16 TaxID=2932253 RepID=UPI00293ED29C|nr:hypothetical protein [Hymenobacter sp. 5516J-16]
MLPIPIYDQKSRIKLVIVGVALLIGAATVIYTNLLVQRLSEREQKQIDLYAKTQRYLINTEEESNVSFLYDEIIEANTTIPVIWADDSGYPLDAQNLPVPKGLSETARVTYLQREMQKMKEQHPPIVIEIGAGCATSFTIRSRRS